MGLPSNFFSIAGATAVITGAASGIGSATASVFGAAGANVIVADRDPEGAERVAAAITEAGGKAVALTVDIADRASVETMAERANAAFGSIDFLVNSAGVTRRFPAVDFPEEEWDRILAINLKGSFLCAQAVGRFMSPRRSGRIVNIASIAGVAGYADTVAYQSSKGGVVQMTRALAAEWGKHGITVNAVAPGIVMTPMQEILRKQDPAKFEGFLSKMAIQQASTPEDIAAAVFFLCTPHAGLITGHVLPVDGGYLAL
jgi:NAD(P)-dependent dehydrogenase (short-subunit alcohol dehydrogenase family)